MLGCPCWRLDAGPQILLEANYPRSKEFFRFQETKTQTLMMERLKAKGEGDGRG